MIDLMVELMRKLGRMSAMASTNLEVVIANRGRVPGPGPRSYSKASFESALQEQTRYRSSKGGLHEHVEARRGWMIHEVDRRVRLVVRSTHQKSR